MLRCLEVLSISTSICFVHLQSLLKLTPKCLCICTGDSEILLKSNSTLFSKCLVLKIIISVLLGLNFTSHLYVSVMCMRLKARFHKNGKVTSPLQRDRILTYSLI